MSALNSPTLRRRRKSHSQSDRHLNQEREIAVGWKLLAASMYAAVGIGLLAGGLPPSARAQEQAPLLRIDSGQHLGAIHAVTVSPDGELIATSGVDKTIRLWRAADGAAVQTIRTPIGDGPDGIVYTLAFNPSGDSLVAGGVFRGDDGKNGVLVIRPGKNVMRGRLPVPGLVRQLAIGKTSTGETRIALALSGASGSGAISIRDGSFGTIRFDRRASAPASIGFFPDGRLAAITDNGWLLIYDEQGETVWSGRVELDATPAVIRPSPDGDHIAIGYWDRPYIDVLRLSDLKRAARLGAEQSPKQEQSHYNALAWVPANGVLGGGELWAGGSAADQKSGRTVIRRWRNIAAAAAVEEVGVADDVITYLQPLPNGAMVYAAADPAWGVINADLTIRHQRNRPGGDYRDAWKHVFAVDEQNSKLAFSFDAARRSTPLEFDAQNLTLDKSPIQGLSDDKTDLPNGWRNATAPEGLTNFSNSRFVRWNGDKLDLLPHELSRSADRIPLGTKDSVGSPLPEGGFILGADRGIYVYDKDGRRVAEHTAATAAFAVLALSDGRIIAAHADGTIRWYRRLGAELTEDAALFVARGSDQKHGRRWLAWTSNGRFAHSANGGQQLAGYHIGQGPKALARWVGFAQIYAEGYDPAYVRTVLVEGRQVNSTLAEAGVSDAVTEIALLTPEVEITEICPILGDTVQACIPATFATRGLGAVEAATSKNTDKLPSYVDGVRELPAEVTGVRLRYRINNIDGIPSKIDVFSNDATTGVKEYTRGLGAAEGTVDGKSEILGEREVFLQDGINRIILRVYDHHGAFGVSRELTLFRPATGKEESRPILYVLAVGADEYGGEIAKLRYAGADAQGIAAAFNRVGAKTYREIKVRSLIGSEAVSRSHVLAAIGYLSEQATPNDSVVIYLAGHGVQNQNGRYVFVPPEVTQIAAIDEAGLNQTQLLSAIGQIRARNRLLLLDTCHAGSFEPPERATGSINNEGGFMVVAAAAPESEALDGYNDQNGVFAFALLEGLNGAAALSSNEVEAAALGLFLRRRVPVLAAEKQFRQRPVIRNPLIDEVFPLTEVTR